MTNTYLDNGLLLFESLRDDKLTIATTFDNKIWGNMNPIFATSDEDKKRISNNDDKIAEYMDVKKNFVLTTPLEATILNFSNSAFNLLSGKSRVDEYLIQYNLIRCNSLFTERKEEKIGFIIAPADSPVVVIANKNRNFVIIMHCGLPQLIQDLDKDTYLLTKNYFDLSQELDVFITPYICKEHYLVSKEKYNNLLNEKGYSFEKYATTKYSEVFKEVRYSIDICLLLKDSIKQLLPKANIIESGVCTYEEAEKGNLFSHKYVTDSKQKGIEINEGNFNVIITI